MDLSETKERLKQPNNALILARQEIRHDRAQTIMTCLSILRAVAEDNGTMADAISELEKLARDIR